MPYHSISQPRFTFSVYKRLYKSHTTHVGSLKSPYFTSPDLNRRCLHIRGMLLCVHLSVCQYYTRVLDYINIAVSLVYWAILMIKKSFFSSEWQLLNQDIHSRIKWWQHMVKRRNAHAIILDLWLLPCKPIHKTSWIPRYLWKVLFWKPMWHRFPPKRSRTSLWLQLSAKITKDIRWS